MIAIINLFIGLIIGGILGMIFGMMIAFYGVKKGWTESDGYYYRGKE